jgi:translation initiation factor IF-2
VREGFECGMSIEGYNDIKVGDLIEAYRVEQIERTLEDSAAAEPARV